MIYKRTFTLIHYALFSVIGLNFMACSGPVKKDVRVETTDSTGSHNNAPLTFQWRKLSDSAAFPKGYNMDMVTDGSNVYVFQQDGVWKSADGANWTKTGLSNILGNTAYRDYIYFKGAVYALGTFDPQSNYLKPKMTSAIYRSTNFETWDTLASTSNLPSRFFHQTLVYDGKIWIAGGYDGKKHCHDVWSSVDGADWKLVMADAPWLPRNPGGLVALGDKMYLIGGGQIDGPIYSDVWSSHDGIFWLMETGSFSQEQVFGYKAATYGNRIWLLGCNRSGSFAGEVMSSVDGKTFVPDTAPWSPRGGVSAVVFKNRLLMTGGKYGGIKGQSPKFFYYSNDIWALVGKP